MNSDDVERQLKLELEKSNELGINGTPTMYINGEKKVGIMPYYEMKALLKKHGARR